MITAQGIGSGLDVASIVSQLVAAEGQPATLRLTRREAGIQAELSALGSLKSALSSFRDTLTPLKDIEVFRSRRASSADADLFTVTANNSAVPSSYDIEILNLAQSHKIASDGFVDVDADIGAGTLVINSGPDTGDTFAIVLDAENSSLADLRDAINSDENNPGVGAAIVTAEDGAHLVLTSTRTGVEHAITITASGETPALDVFSYGPGATGSTMSELQAAQDANILVDSFAHSSTTNNVTGVIDGVTLSLQSAAPGSPASLSVQYDVNSATQKVREFVEGYNSLVDSLASLASYDADSGVAGALLGDSSLREVSSAIRRTVGGGGIQLNGSFATLSSIGVTTELDGKLTIDESMLSDQLSEDFNAVGRLFADEGGFALRLDEVLEPFIETGGRLDDRTEGLEKSIELIADQRAALDVRLASVEARYLRQFSALDSIVAELSSTSDFLAQQLLFLPNGR